MTRLKAALLFMVVAVIPGAGALRDRARDLYRQATAARDAGDSDAAMKLLDDAKKETFNAVRVAGSGEEGIAKQKDDFETRATSVQTLLKAHKIVFDEDATRNTAASPV